MKFSYMIGEAKDVREKSMTDRTEDRKAFLSGRKEIPNNGTGPYIDGDKIINNKAEKAEVITEYFCSAFGKKQDDVLIVHEDGDHYLAIIK